MIIWAMGLHGCCERGRGDCGGAAWRMVARRAKSMTREVPSQSFRLELQFERRNVEFVSAEMVSHDQY